jgi:hypothetical protein
MLKFGLESLFTDTYRSLNLDVNCQSPDTDYSIFQNGKGLALPLLFGKEYAASDQAGRRVCSVWSK